MDALIQMSEVFRMSEDMQTAADLIGKNRPCVLYLHQAVLDHTCMSSLFDCKNCFVECLLYFFDIFQFVVERALFSFEMSFHSLFSLTTGNCRLDFKLAENR